MRDNRPTITSYKDLEVYQNSYAACVTVFKHIIPQLPSQEKYDLIDQLSRASKAIPRLIAEGYAKRHQKAGFQKYLYDAMAETNEVIVCLEQSVDLYGLPSEETAKLVDLYDKTARQLYKLLQSWKNFKENSSNDHRSSIRTSQPTND